MAASPPPSQRRSGLRLFARLDRAGARALAVALRGETVGGLLLLAGAVVALVWANSPWKSGYASFTDVTFGPRGLDLHLSVRQWASDGLLAVFFFVTGLELKREFVAGDLRSPRRAALPILAAVGGMIGPVIVYLLVNTTMRGGTPDGWAVPMATDIAFAVAVLAVVSTHLPSGLRSFLLTLAVVDDLLSVLVIAVVFAGHISLWPLLGSFAAVAVFGLLARRGVTRWWILGPLGVGAWALMHASGVHATIAGVLLGFAVPALSGPGGRTSLAERFEYRWRPVSAGFVVPLFSLVSAGVSLSGGLGPTLRDPVGLGVGLGLVVGKLIGVFGSTYLLARFTRATLDAGLSWWDVLGISLLAGVGFTVSMLVGELSFTPGTPRENHVKTAILLGSLTSALLATTVLRWRDRLYRRLAATATVTRGAQVEATE
ncbi:sodium/proton antiporter, NhaA family [Actinacidiphila alni]|uniref:Na(+)/H(+) antiporter NhaA n=1 Tax=Actinacidiphila alni TaxID=380248 RepID=A0A1I2JWT9_9ACTN|nr:Na+/H+ antiporter NhaA [Actinacidiphila alni]SFF59305.1 sodium/proton antiporter, NhaA family [Actinacidiphila alni]